MKRLKQPHSRWLTFWKPSKKLEIAVTDFCNLDCPLCSQGTPIQKDKKTMPLRELERISKFFRPFEFDTIKLSGGEPTLHPQFGEICGRLKELFPAYAYTLATNGCLLEKYLDHLEVFNHIELSLYPGKNDSTCLRLTELKLPNLGSLAKEDYCEMEDVYKEADLDISHICKSCKWTYINKIVQSSIYPCCIIFGQSIRQNIDRNKIGVPIDENWREHLIKISLEPYCKHCFVNVDTGSYPRLVRKPFQNVIDHAILNLNTIGINRGTIARKTARLRRE